MRPAAHGRAGSAGCPCEIAAAGRLLRLAVAAGGHVVKVLEQLGEPVLGRLVLLQALCERVVLQLVGQTLAKRLASPDERKIVTSNEGVRISSHLWLSDSLR